MNVEEIEITQRDAMLDLYPLVVQVAKRVASTWQGSVDVDELTQDIGSHLLEYGRAVALWHLSVPGRVKGLNIVARQIASEQRESLSIFKGQFNYTTKEVRVQLGRRALSRDADYEMTGDYSDFDSDGELTASSTLEINVDNIDLREAFKKLGDRHKKILLDEYEGDGWKGHTQEITDAVDALTRLMNRNHRRRWDEYEGPGSRRVMSNASARRNTQRNY